MLNYLAILAAILGSILSASYISSNSQGLTFYIIFVLVLLTEAMKYLSYSTAISSAISDNQVKKYTGMALLLLAVSLSTASGYSQYQRINSDLSKSSTQAFKELQITTDKLQNLEQKLSNDTKILVKYQETNQRTKASQLELSINETKSQIEELTNSKNTMDLTISKGFDKNYANLVAIVLALSVELFPILLLILSGTREIQRQSAKITVNSKTIDEYLDGIEKGKRVFSTDLGKFLGVPKDEALKMMEESPRLKRVGRYFMKKDLL